MEQSAILAVAKDDGICSCLARADSLAKMRQVLEILAENHIPIRFFHCKNEGVFSFIIQERWVNEVQDLLKNHKSFIQFEPVSSVTLVGTGMAESSGIVAKIMEILPENNIPLLDIYSTHLQISCIIPRGLENKLETRFHRHFVEAASLQPASQQPDENEDSKNGK